MAKTAIAEPPPSFSRYRALLSFTRTAAGYMTDPIGKCLRTTSKREPPRIDLDYLGSETFKAALRREDLSLRFDNSRTIKANLIWVEVPETGELSLPYLVLVDPVSGIIEETRPTGVKRYAFLSDVQGCLHYTSQEEK